MVPETLRCSRTKPRICARLLALRDGSSEMKRRIKKRGRKREQSKGKKYKKQEKKNGAEQCPLCSIQRFSARFDPPTSAQKERARAGACVLHPNSRILDVFFVFSSKKNNMYKTLGRVSYKLHASLSNETQPLNLQCVSLCVYVCMCMLLQIADRTRSNNEKSVYSLRKRIKKCQSSLSLSPVSTG